MSQVRVRTEEGARSYAGLRSGGMLGWVRTRLAAPLGVMTAMAGAEAQAHVLEGHHLSFLTGFAHPISGWDHILAMLAVGLWGSQLGRPALWLLPITFPLIMAVGGFLGLIGVHIPATEVLIALSAVLLGWAVLLRVRPPIWAAVGTVAIFGLCHGYAHGVELPPGQDAALYSLGFVIATGLVHAVGISIGLLDRWKVGRFGVRALGGAIGVAGLFFLWSAAA